MVVGLVVADGSWWWWLLMVVVVVVDGGRSLYVYQPFTHRPIDEQQHERAGHDEHRHR